MAPKWFRNNNEEGEGVAGEEAKKNLQSIEIKPEMLESAMKPHLEAQETRFSNLIDDKLKTVNEYFAAQAKEREEQQRRQQHTEENPEELDYLSDPAGAIDKKLQPLIRSQQAANALLMINETIGEMDYYKSDPTFKAKVLAKINSQPL